MYNEVAWTFHQNNKENKAWKLIHDIHVCTTIDQRWNSLLCSIKLSNMYRVSYHSRLDDSKSIPNRFQIDSKILENNLESVWNQFGIEHIIGINLELIWNLWETLEKYFYVWVYNCSVLCVMNQWWDSSSHVVWTCFYFT